MSCMSLHGFWIELYGTLGTLRRLHVSLIYNISDICNIYNQGVEVVQNISPLFAVYSGLAGLASDTERITG